MKPFPPEVGRRILRRFQESAEPLVLVARRGVPTRVFGLREYEKMRLEPRKHRPWQRRRGLAAAAPDPLGARDGKVLGPLRRRDLYE